MADEIQQFGRFLILNRLAVGGTAAVFRAKMTGEGSAEGAGRLVALKIFHPDQGEANFLRAFKTEIKILMSLTHPSIPRLYDYGEEDGKPFMALEYVDGRTLRQICMKFAEMNMVFPIDLVAHIGSEAAQALDYAHNFKDPITNQSSIFVHRDISPQNIMVSFDGNVKVIDFGIAKILSEATATREGLVKGKPSYLSPEQLNGDELDGRSDVFSLCAVLWELLAGQKLFVGDHPEVVFRKILACEKIDPPSRYNPAVPEELDALILKGLARDRNLRHASAAALQKELQRFLYSFLPDFNPGDVVGLIKPIFQREIEQDAVALREVARQVPPSKQVGATDEDRIIRQKLREQASGARELSVGQAKPGAVIIDLGAGPREPHHARREPSLGLSRADLRTSSTRFTKTQTQVVEERSGSPFVAVLQALALIAALGFFGPKFGFHIPLVSDLFYGMPAQVAAAPPAQDEVVKLIDVPQEEIKKTLELREKTKKARQ